MPVYNSGKFLKQAIESILNQTYENFELLIADDGSTDNSWEIINSYDDSRVLKFHFESNIGNLSICNYLFSKCNGAYIGIQDADDWCDTDRIEKQVNFLTGNNNVGLVSTAFAVTDESGVVNSRHAYSYSPDEIIEFILAHQYLPFHCAAVLVRKTVLDKAGFYRNYFDRIGAADFDWVYRIAAISELGLINDTYYYYRKNSLSFTNTFNKNLYRKFSEKVAFYLFEQRRRTGYDSIDNNDIHSIDTFLNPLMEPYKNNKGLIYIDEAKKHLRAGEFLNTIKYSLQSVMAAPGRISNYVNLLKNCKFIIWKSFK